MIKFTRKTVVVLVLAAGMLLGLVSCGKEEKTQNQNNSDAAAGQDAAQADIQAEAEENPKAEGNYYTGEYQVIPEKDTIEMLAVAETAVYYLKHDKSEGLKERIMKYDMDSGKVTELPDAVREGSSILGLCVNGKGNLLALRISGENNVIHYGLTEVGEDGDVIYDKEITDLLEETKESYFHYIKAAEDGRIYLSGGRTVWVLDEEGNEEFRLSTDNPVSGMGILPGGKLGVFILERSGPAVKVLDCEKGEWGDTYKNDRFGLSLSFTEQGDGGIYFYNSEELYSYDPETGETEVLADWLHNDIYAEYILYLSVQEDSLHLITCDYDAGGSELAVLKRTEMVEESEKQEITLGTIKLSSGLRGCITNFNKKSDKYRVEVIEYGEGTSYSAGVTRFNNEIIAGNIPDIINITDGTEEFYAAKGIFEDLKPYFDGGYGISRADYFNNILTAMETDGKLYFLSPDFYIDTIVGKTAEVGEGYSWTMEDMKSLEEARREGVEMFDGETKSGILDVYLRYNMAQFFDLNKGFCEFDNASFREVLEFTDRFPQKAASEDSGITWERARNGELLLLKSKIKGIADYQLCHNIFDADISFVGYPSKFDCGSVAKGGMVTMAMNAGSENKEGAWSFIRSLLEEDYQNKYTDFFPLLRSAFDKAADEAMLSAICTDENGNKVNGGESVSVATGVMTSSGEMSTFGVEIHPAKEEEIAAIRGLIEKIDRMERFDETVLSIVSEEAGAYFGGQKSVDEVISVIQSRASIYMNENRW